MRREERPLVLGALAVGALVQTAWAIAQVVKGAPLGITFLFENPRPLVVLGDAIVPRGSMPTTTLLPTLALVVGGLVAMHAVASSRPMAWATALAGIVVPIGLTYSRGALVAVLAIVASLAPRAWSGSLARRLVIAALVGGVGVPAVLTASGWLARAEQFSEERPDSGRGILLLQGLTVFAMEPLTGVGPGRYVDTLRTLSDDVTIQRRLTATHFVPLLVAAEEGVLGGATVLVLLGALGLRALRDRDDAALALYFAYVTFWLLEYLPYALPQGLLFTGLWLGALDAAHDDRAA
jgi:cell division protein FtsW (lipid II flippase)